jgi:class 3 adenylate cyclase
MRGVTVREWLAAEGLPQYIDLFAQNRVELDVLPDLTERDLKDLGIPLGDRKRLLKAIQSLVQPKLADAPAPQAPIDAERRQLTVMFCDLVGSTALSERLDPEELRDLMQAYQRSCGEVISRYEGHVAQYLGDGLMVYFDWPTAHEDDASRAIRAGLETVEAVSKLSGPMPLCARVGIHTGLVVVGETGRGDASVPKAAVGDTPNIAARLQGLAAPGAVVISARTRALVGGLFDYTALGAQALKASLRRWPFSRLLGHARSQAASRLPAAKWR